MIKIQAEDYFSEVCEEGGTILSFKIDKKLHSEKTAFQEIDIYHTEEFGNLMVIDGFVMLTARDNFLYHEMISHPALFSHSNPKNIVIVGGGDCGTLKEVLKHESVEQVLQVEIDERVTRLAEQYFPELCEKNSDPRARFYFGDGVEWMQQAEAGSIDVIIVDSTDPIGPAEGLFNRAFYQSCHTALAKEGVLIQQSESPMIHLSLLADMRDAMRSAGFNSLQTFNFPQPCYPSGWWSTTLAGKETQFVTREQDIRNKSFATDYYSADLHFASQVQAEFVRRRFAQ